MEFSFTTVLFHIAFLIIAPPFFLGVIAKTKALFVGRKGPPLLQAYFDLFKLVGKETVYSHSSTLVLRVAPLVIVSVLLLSGLFVPLLGRAVISFAGDLILFAYLLGLVRFFIILAAMDVGSSFEGLGASREATLGALSELAFLLGLVALSLIANSTSLSEMFAAQTANVFWTPALVILFIAFLFILLTENSRMPVDDPTTHLELTMIHEVMILDYGGPDLAIMLYAASIKLFLFMVITASMLWPTAPLSLWGSVGCLVMKVTGMAIAIGVIESTNARVRLVKIPQYLIANFILTALALVMILSKKGM